MGLPAARITDMHVCPMFTGPVPHVGGPILIPSTPTVLIGCLPAAGVGSMCVCAGPPDVIVRGSFTVLIGGRPAARMGDNTAHGGVVALGCFNVLIGMAGAASSGSPGTASSSAGAGTPFSGGPCSYCLAKAKRTAKALISFAAEAAKTVGTAVADGIKTVDEWGSHEGELKKWGNDSTNVKLGSWGTDSNIGWSKETGKEGFDVIKLGAHAEAFSANAKGGTANGLVDGEAHLSVLEAEAEAGVGASWNDKAKDIHARVGGELNVAKVEGKGGINIPIPFTGGWALHLGGKAQAQVGASASVEAHAGYTEENGYSVGASAKAALGLGGGLGFSIGVKPPPSAPVGHNGGSSW